MWDNYWDGCFLVNLKRRFDRYDTSERELLRYNIPFVLWEATENINGRLGLIQTMISLFTFVLSRNFSRILVLEDDFKLIQNPAVCIPDCFEQLPQDFHLFYLGCNLAKPPLRISENILQTKAAYSSHAVVYSRAAIELIMRELEKATVYDIFLVNKIQSKEKSYCSFPMIASQWSGFSDIDNKVVNYERFLEKRFYKQTRDI